MTTLCLVFDLDDTLFPEHEYVRSGFRAVGEFIEREFNVSGFHQRAVADFEDGRRGDIFNRTLGKLGVDYDQQLIKKLVEVYRSHSPCIELFKDAKEFLSAYNSVVPLCLITDGYLIAQKNKVQSLNISPYFRSIIYTDELGRDFWKPHPRSFQTIEDYIGGPPTEFVYIGDNEQKDFIAPNSLGWRTVKVKRDTGEYKEVEVPAENQAQHTISTLDELADLLRL